MLVLLIRRKVLKAEFGGPLKFKILSVAILILAYVVFIVVAAI
jgi:hypothetical protein